MAFIDLSKHEAQVTDFCVAALEAFSREHFDTKVSSVVLYSYPSYGTLIFCLDTVANAAKHSEDDAPPHDPGFSFVCPHFAFFDWRRLNIEEWSEAYDSVWIDGNEPLEIRTVSGESIAMGEDDGDETLNKPVLELLVKAMREMTRHPVTEALNHEARLCIGVQIEESACSEYWSLPNGAA